MTVNYQEVKQLGAQWARAEATSDLREKLARAFKSEQAGVERGSACVALARAILAGDLLPELKAQVPADLFDADGAPNEKRIEIPEMGVSGALVPDAVKWLAAFVDGATEDT